MARCIDQRDLRGISIAPADSESRLSREDGDTPVSLDLAVIEERVPVVDSAEFPDLSCLVENGL